MFGIGFLVGYILFVVFYKYCEYRFKKTKYKITYDAKNDEYDLWDPDKGFDGEVIFSGKTIEEVIDRHKMILEKQNKLIETLPKK